MHFNEKLIFDITKIWYSFTSVPDEISSLIGINEAIEYIFESIEDDYSYNWSQDASFI